MALFEFVLSHLSFEGTPNVDDEKQEEDASYNSSHTQRGWSHDSQLGPEVAYSGRPRGQRSRLGGSIGRAPQRQVTPPMSAVAKIALWGLSAVACSAAASFFAWGAHKLFRLGRQVWAGEHDVRSISHLSFFSHQTLSNTDER